MFKTLDKLKPPYQCLYVVDPIAALYAEQEKKSDKMSQARAKALQKHMRFLKDRVVASSNKRICVVFSNQLIDAVGQTMGPKKITPGGNAMIHWPSVRVKFASPGKLWDEAEGRKDVIKRPIGVKLFAEVTKNGVDDAFRTANITIINGYGIDDIRDNALWLKEHTKVLGKSDGWFKMPRKKGGPEYKSQQGILKFVDFVEKENIEKRLAFLTRKYYKLWHAPVERKPKVR
jgi:hypothetical protein